MRKKTFQHNIQSFWLGLLFIAALTAFSCKDKDPEPEPDYDRAVMLQNLSSVVILPAYNNLKLVAEGYAGLYDAFVANPDPSTLMDMRNGLKNLWLAWVSASSFEFGPAQNVVLRSAVNTFPADETQIESNITAMSWDLQQAVNIDARGLPALDYLLNKDDESTTLTAFTTAPDASSRMAYLAALVTDVTGLMAQMHEDWTSGDTPYRNTFSENQGTDVGSSTGMLINQLNFDLEITKNARLGIPLGKKTLGQILPGHVEAFYGEFSSDLVLAHLQGLRAIYTCELYGADGYGLDDALDALEATYNGGPLSDAIDTQFDAALAAAANLTNPLSTQIQNDPATVDAAYAEIQKLVVLLKTDLASAMGIAITYQDNDGD